MPYISCHVDERTLRILERESVIRGHSVQQLAERAIESSAITTLPGGYPGGFDGQHFAPSHREVGRMDMENGVSIGFEERSDGSFRITP